MGFIEDLRAKQARDAAVGVSTPAAAPAAPPGVLPLSDAPPPAAPLSVRERIAAAAINPPEFVPPADAAPAPAPAPVPPAGVVASAGGAGAPAPRRGRGRPRADATAVAVAPAGISVTDTVVPASDMPQKATVTIGAHSASFQATVFNNVMGILDRAPRATPLPMIPPPAAADGFVLCVNCAPIGQPVVLFSQYASIVHAGIKESKGVDLYNLLGYDGNALFQDALRQALEQSPPQGYLVVNAGTNEGRDAMSVLERHATLVIRGF